MEVRFQRFDILVEIQSAHGPQQIVSIDRFPLLSLTFIASSAFLCLYLCVVVNSE